LKDLVLLLHASFGALGCIAAVWVLAETLNASVANLSRIRLAALVTAVCMTAAWILGGYWYVRFYPAEKAMILAGPWPFAHNVAMETKEHLFFVTGILAFYLPIAAFEKLHENPMARRMVMTVAGLVVFSGLAVEGAGAIINHGAKLALLQRLK
jgi:uncharacterized membrane protein YwaF